MPAVTVNCLVVTGFNLNPGEIRYEPGDSATLNQADYDYLFDRLAVVLP